MNKDVLGEMGEVEEEAKEFLSSLEDDEWLFESDILVSKAHALMLFKNEIIPKEVTKEIIKALDKINYSEISGEDVHVAIESFLKKKIGEKKSGWLHTARSRNDEVATCIRIRLRDELINISKKLSELIEVILIRSKDKSNKLFPGFTHLQHAEPTTIGHHLSSYSNSLIRDLERLIGAYERTNKSPLGSGALSTTTFEIDREKTANYLGFDGVIKNSIDAVTSRDFVIESISVFSTIMNSLSQLSQELITWSTEDFSFVELPDEFTSTSSIMPQKKNPDILELIRAKTSSVHGNLVSVNGILKSNSRSYNRDLQELNPKLWESIRIVKKSIVLMKKIIEKTEFKEKEIIESLKKDKSEASELANEYVRKKNIPFRVAHNRISELIQKKSDIQEIVNELGLDGVNINKKEIIEKKNITGGPSPNQLKNDLIKQEKDLQRSIDKINEKKMKRDKKISSLRKDINDLID